MAQFLAFHGPGSKARLVCLLCQNMGVSRADIVRLTRNHISGSVIRYSRTKTGVPVEYPISPDLAAELARLPRDQLLLVSHARACPTSPRRWAIGSKIRPLRRAFRIALSMGSGKGRPPLSQRMAARKMN